MTGAVAAQGSLQIVAIFFILWAAGTAGDSTNYWIGRLAGEKAFGRFLNRKYLERTHQFYEKYGANTIVLARFVPIVRTFAPFVAGWARCAYRRFVTTAFWVNCCGSDFHLRSYFFATFHCQQHFLAGDRRHHTDFCDAALVENLRTSWRSRRPDPLVLGPGHL